MGRRSFRAMADEILIKNYSDRSMAKIKELLREYLADSWLAARSDEVYQICDELLKNALKSNYKFLLLWMSTRQRMLDSDPEMSEKDADDWLQEVLFSGENILIEKQIEKIPDRNQIQVKVRQLLNLENLLMKSRRPGQMEETARGRGMTENDLKFFLRIKRMARHLKIFIQFRIERAPDQVLISISNDAPILDEDLGRIHRIRNKFYEYAREGRHQDFFIDNLDTSGGGFGLGYALMDSVLTQLDLDPQKSLYLISATRTMVLVALPREAPAALVMAAT